MALVEARIDPRVVFDDFAAGEGKGLNILLQYGSIQLLLTEYADIWKWPTRSRKTLVAACRGALSHRLACLIILSRRQTTHHQSRDFATVTRRQLPRISAPSSREDRSQEFTAESNAPC